MNTDYILCLSSDDETNDGIDDAEEEITCNIGDGLLPVDVKNNPSDFEVAAIMVSLYLDKKWTGYCAPLAVKTNIIRENTTTGQQGMAMLNVVEIPNFDPTKGKSHLQVTQRYEIPIYHPYTSGLSPKVKIVPIKSGKTNHVSLSRANVILSVRRIL